MDWPTREPEQAVEVVATKETGTHRFELTSDGILCIQRNERRDQSQDPQLLKKTEGLPNYSILNRENLEALIVWATEYIAKAS
jgi:hypothetical protein